MGELMARGLARSTVTRALATLRSLLAFAVADGRVTVNVAAMAKAPTGGQAGREGQLLSLSELEALASASHGPYGDLIMVLGLEGLRWGEVAGLQVGDRVSVPGPGLRLSRTVLASNGGGALFVDLVEEPPGANRTADHCGGADRRAVGGWKVAERVAVSCAGRRAAKGGELEAIGEVAGGCRGNRSPQAAGS